jgi:hypothetical protein
VWRRQVGLVRGTRWLAESTTGRMVARTAGRSRGRFLVEPQNQGRARTTWESSHEWRLVESTLWSQGLQLFTRKPMGYSLKPQNRGRRLDEEVRPPRPVELPRSAGQTAWAGLTAQGGDLTARVAAIEKLRSEGHASRSQGLRQG